jgi:transposase
MAAFEMVQTPQWRQGGINKHGNPLMRKVLIEATWRLVPSGKTKLGKKNIVALARGLAVDL